MVQLIHDDFNIAVWISALFVLLILASMASSVLSVGLTIWLSCRYTFDKQGRILPVFTPKA